MSQIKQLLQTGALARALEIAANLATLLAALLLSVFLVKSTIRPPAPAPSGPQRAVNPADLAGPGADMSKRIPAVNWRANGRTLVFVLSTQCHFCTESAPFFRRLKERAGNSVKFLAVLPQPVPESERYLRGESLRFDDIRQRQYIKQAPSEPLLFFL